MCRILSKIIEIKNLGVDVLNLPVLIIVFEILCINTYTTYSCSKKKTSPFGSAFSVYVFTAAYSVLLIFIYLQIPMVVSFTGKGIFMLYGFIYVIPLKFMFDQSLKHTIIIMSSSWIYTMFAYSFAVRAGYLFPLDQLALSIAIVQTLFFAITLPAYIKFIKKTFIYILMYIEKQMLNSLLVISLSWFFIIFLLNYGFVEGFSSQLKFIMLFVILGNAILSYKMLNNLVSINNKAVTLSKITKIDALTQLKNRESLYEDVLQKLGATTPFTIVFVDLDDFKSVNDCLGHAAGDAYLIEFANTVNQVLKIKDRFYRLHGDEFVFLVDELKAEAFCNKLKDLKFVNKPEGLAFRGLSLGFSSFPADGNTLSDLLHLADLRMYQVKKGQHKENKSLSN